MLRQENMSMILTCPPLSDVSGTVLLISLLYVTSIIALHTHTHTHTHHYSIHQPSSSLWSLSHRPSPCLQGSGSGGGWSQLYHRQRNTFSTATRTRYNVHVNPNIIKIFDADIYQTTLKFHPSYFFSSIMKETFIEPRRNQILAELYIINCHQREYCMGYF